MCQLVSVTFVRKNCSYSPARLSGAFKKNLKKRPSCTRLCTIRFRLFLDHYRTNLHKTWYALPVGTHYAGLIVQLKRLGLFGTSAEYLRDLRKSGLFLTLFSQIGEEGRHDKCCGKLSGFNVLPYYYLAVPFLCKTLLVLQFWLFFGYFGPI